MITTAQQTVFSDTFGSSTLNQTNAFPGGTPTASSTSYTVASPKNVTTTSVAAGHLLLITPSTSSANTEIQAMFTKFPVSLVSVGDYIEMTYTFTDRTNQMNNVGGNGSGFHMGLYNSGGTPPLGGTILWNSGMGSAQTAYVGGASNWVGNVALMNFSQTAGSAWGLFTRPVQTIAQNIDQELLFNDNNPKGATLASVTPAAFPFPLLNIGSQYTAQLRITLSAPGQLTISNGLYAGVDTTGTLIFSNVAAAVTGANLLTTNFDGLAIGYRAVGGNVSWTNDINSITVVAGLAAQAGPYFTLTSSGTGCGSAPIGLNGSVTTNVYMLYTNGVFTGQAIAGTGSPLNFGVQTLAGVYTIVASNTVNSSVGPMYGSQTISQSAPVIVLQPANVSCVTNAPALFTVSATGNTLTYQWYKNGVALANGGDYLGVNTSNLLVSPAQAADAATTANGYHVVIMDPCGDSTTSAPNASLTLLAPNNLVWQGNNAGGSWDTVTSNFTNSSGASVIFNYGDNVLFNDTSPNTTVTLATNLIPSLVTVSGTQSYTFTGPGNITGFGGLVDNSSRQLTIISTNTYAGVTIVNTNATLNLGNNNSGNDGFISGVINIKTNGVLNYNYNNNANIASSLTGSGTVNYESSLGGTLTLSINANNTNFNGVANLISGVRVHAQTGSVFPFGNGSVVNVPAFSQAWCDTATYNNVFNIAGTGWIGTTPPTGAISVFGSIFTGAINLTDDARISGTISGGTILCAISGPHQLEIWGNLGSYVLSIGPTNGVHSYASTLITSGTVRALNTNAICTGPLIMDVAGDLRLNSFNLSVSNLASINSGNVTGPGATIQNTGTTNAILTVGADNANTGFNGVFTNGGTGAIGLTKIGAGTLTLTGVSSNTGPVTVLGGTLAMSGSGSFGSASVIAPASGAIYDVTGAGGTLTLNSGQRLSGNGTINGVVVASAGSTVASGMPLGTLTISGNGTVNGTYQASLNRTNTPSNCSHLVSSGGSITYSGATISVTNIGQTLQVGDTFQLFPGATAGFSTSSLQTTDTLNNAIYTWNNNVSTSGSISVASVTPTTIIPNVPPKITSFSLAGGSASITATNGVNGGTYYLLGTTNLTLSRSQWTAVATNVVTASGGSASFTFTGTNVFSVTAPQKFFMLSSTNH